MTREETMKAIAVMQAYVDGEEIEYNDYASGLPTHTWKTTPNVAWDWGRNEYRVKPRPKCRPYKDMHEFATAILQPDREFLTDRRNKNVRYTIHAITNDRILVNSDQSDKACSIDKVYFYDSLAENCTWKDGTPCGVVTDGE